jgi:hypothetical protein
LATYTSIRLTRISLALKRSRSSRHDGRPQRPAQRAGDDRQRHEGPAVHADLAFGDPQRQAAGGDAADQELALGADVPHIAAEAQRQAQAAQDQRRGLQAQLGERAQAVEGFEQEDRQALDRILAQGAEQDGGHHDGDGQGDER